MSEKEIKELREKILQGITLAFRKLVEQKAKDDKDLVFSEGGKIVRIKAKDIKPA